MFEFSAAIRPLWINCSQFVVSWLGKGHVVDESSSCGVLALPNRFCGLAQGAGSPVCSGDGERPVQHHGERSPVLPELLGDGLAPIPWALRPLRPCLLAG